MGREDWVWHPSIGSDWVIAGRLLRVVKPDPVGEWFIRRGPAEYRAPDLATLRQWFKQGSLGVNDLVWHPSLGTAWKKAPEVLAPPQQAPKKKKSGMGKTLMRAAIGIGVAVVAGEALGALVEDDSLDILGSGAIDLDGDGVADALGIIGDTNADGIADVFAIDEGFDGQVDLASMDLNHDGFIDSVVADTDGNGVIDTSVFDVNHDRVMDAVAFDTTGDSVADFALIDRSVDMTKA